MTSPSVHDIMHVIFIWCPLYLYTYIHTFRHLSKLEFYYIYDDECTAAVYSLVIAFFTHKLLCCGSEYESPGDFSIFISDTFRSRKSVRRRVDFGLETLSVGTILCNRRRFCTIFIWRARVYCRFLHWNIAYRPYILLLYPYPTVRVGVWIFEFVVALLSSKRI